VHGDSVGAETLRRSLDDWLTDMNLISAGGAAEADGYIGYMEPYATSHEAFDKDEAFQEEVLNVARALGAAVELARTGHLEDPRQGTLRPAAEMTGKNVLFPAAQSGSSHPIRVVEPFACSIPNGRFWACRLLPAKPTVSRAYPICLENFATS
jgi:hypothetical protein